MIIIIDKTDLCMILSVFYFFLLFLGVFSTISKYELHIVSLTKWKRNYLLWGGDFYFEDCTWTLVYCSHKLGIAIYWSNSWKHYWWVHRIRRQANYDPWYHHAGGSSIWTLASGFFKLLIEGKFCHICFAFGCFISFSWAECSAS